MKILRAALAAVGVASVIALSSPPTAVEQYVPILGGEASAKYQDDEVAADVSATFSGIDESATDASAPLLFNVLGRGRESVGSAEKRHISYPGPYSESPVWSAPEPGAYEFRAAMLLFDPKTSTAVSTGNYAYTRFRVEDTDDYEIPIRFDMERVPVNGATYLYYVEAHRYPGSVFEGDTVVVSRSGYDLIDRESGDVISPSDENNGTYDAVLTEPYSASPYVTLVTAPTLVKPELSGETFNKIARDGVVLAVLVIPLIIARAFLFRNEQAQAETARHRGESLGNYDYKAGDPDPASTTPKTDQREQPAPPAVAEGPAAQVKAGAEVLKSRYLAALSRAESLLREYSDLHADPVIRATALIERPLLLDLAVYQTRVFEDQIVVLHDLVSNPRPADEDYVDDLTEKVVAARTAFDAADAHARKVGVPGVTESGLRRGRLLLDKVLDDRNSHPEERARAWEMLVALVRKSGISEEAIKGVTVSVRKLLPAGTQLSIES